MRQALRNDRALRRLGHANVHRWSDHDSLIAPWVIKGAMNGEAFATHIRQVLVPELMLGTVVICDNLATHCNKDAAQALKDVGCGLLYLPPYSPDLNLIEMAFSKLKEHL